MSDVPLFPAESVSDNQSGTVGIAVSLWYWLPHGIVHTIDFEIDLPLGSHFHSLRQARLELLCSNCLHLSPCLRLRCYP
jgi:hypothetical protein